MGLNGFSQDPVQAPMSLVSCCSGFEWLSPLGLGSGMRCEESHWNRTAPPSHRHLCAAALPQERTQKVSIGEYLRYKPGPQFMFKG